MSDLPSGTRSAIAGQVAAAGRRDRAALLKASEDLLHHAWVRPRRGVPISGAYLYDRLIGSLLLTGRGRAAAATMRAVAARQEGDNSWTPLARLPEAEWDAAELLLLRELRLLELDWRPLPGIPGRRDLRVLGKRQQRQLRNFQTLAGAFRGRDPEALAKAIAATGRADSADFSVLAYALYEAAQRNGIQLKVPRRYAF